MTLTDTEHQVLVDLEARAGASDQDRAAWLAERRQGVTATEIRDVMLAGSREQAIRDLVKKKREGDPFTGNAYTEWGKEREPIIAAKLAGVGMRPESRVFHAAVNSRHLASPDGLAVDFDGDLTLHEIKTTGKPLTKGSQALAEKGYEWQMDWCCYVMGATGCWLDWEMRFGQPGSFSAGPLERDWFPRDDERIAEMIAVADEILAAMDDEPAPINEEVDTHAVNYLRAIEEEKAWAALKKESYDALIDLGISQESALARVTITPGKPAAEFEEEVVDLDAAAAAHPKETAQLERAKARVVKLQAAWDALANEHKKTVLTKSSATRGRAKVTAVKPREKSE